jgi:hypothetical protein
MDEPTLLCISVGDDVNRVDAESVNIGIEQSKRVLYWRITWVLSMSYVSKWFNDGNSYRSGDQELLVRELREVTTRMFKE